MSSPEPASLNPVQYAEKVLDVHGPWEEAQRRLEAHEHASEGIDNTKREIRAIKSQIEARKATILSEAPSLPGYPESGVQARRDFVKQQVETDTVMQDLEVRLNGCQSALEGYQAEARHHELGIGVLTGRLTELGGLLHFYAAAKEAQTAARAHQVQHVTHDTGEQQA